MRFEVAGQGWSEEYRVRKGPIGREWQLTDEDGHVHELRVTKLEGASVLRVTTGDETHTLTLLPGNRPGDPLRFLLNDSYHELLVKDDSDFLQDVLGSEAGATGEERLESPMPGIIREIRVAEGDEVEADQPLLVLEAMKMENEIRAPRAGQIQRIHVAAGSTVAASDILITIE